MPDINSMPASSHQPDTSRRASTQQPIALNTSDPSLNILPSNQNAVNPPAPSTSSTAPPSQLASPLPASSQPLNATHGESDLVSGPGPLRHPRPLTATELHMQLEKEQEAVVNRLTRELSLLRAAQNASVVSNASSTSASASIHESTNESSIHHGPGLGLGIPTPRRHRRTSSSASQNILSSSYDARTQATMPTRPMSISRQNSTASRRSQNNSPTPSSSLDPSHYFHSQRMPPPTSVPMSGASSIHHGAEQLSPGIMPATLRYEETQHFKSELEAAKRENEALKQRVRELERQVQQRRASDASLVPSETLSTTASMSVAPSRGTSVAGPRVSASSRSQRDRAMTTQSTTSDAIGVPEDEVKVGESAASSGLANKPQ